MPNDMTEESLEYFQQYRDLIRMHSDNIKHIQVLETEAENLKRSSKNMLNEINAMKRIMTYMIDNGVDPVEAKLKIDENNRDSHWNNSELEREKEYMKKLMMQQMVPMGTMGAMGATGAVGVYDTTTTIGPPKGWKTLS